MTIPNQLSQQIAAFPAPLRELITAELKAGNTIVAIENGFPAAPCGASIKLARAVEAGRRKSTGEVKFYARNNSSYAGEFTTEPRHFFVLEPPLPPEPAPDMDAIRKALEPKSDVLADFAQREARSGWEVGRALLRERLAETNAKPARTPRRALTSTETATSAKRLLHFRDLRPPHEIQFALERALMTLFAVAMKNERLTMTTNARVVGARYDIELRFEAAMALNNCYSLRVETSWAEAAATQHDYYRKTSDSWFNHWTRDFIAANPPAADAGSSARYKKLCLASLNAEAHLDTVPALQQAVIAGMKRGGRFATSHKEGGTNITWRIDRFIRSDYGDDPDLKVYTDETEFLGVLRQFWHWDVACRAKNNQLSEFDAWKLILRRMLPK